MSAPEATASLLRSALARLQQTNKAISLRSLAARLDLSPSYLSKVFRGERRLPLKQVGRLAKLLRLDHHETAELQRCVLGELETVKMGTGIRTQSGALAPEGNVPRKFRSLSEPDYWLLEKWYHVPLLNLATVKDFVPEKNWIAGRLGISPREAESSLDRLLRDGYLLRDEDGTISRSQLQVRFPTTRSHERLRAFHRNMIARAADLLVRPPTEEEFAERLLSGLSLAGDPRQLASAKLIIEEALYRAAETLASGECTEIFQINLQLFKVTK